MSHACDGPVGRVLRRSHAPRVTVLQNHQLASHISQVITSPVIHSDNARAYRRGSCVRLNLAHGEAVAQTFPSIVFAPNVAPQVRPRRRAGLGGLYAHVG